MLQHQGLVQERRPQTIMEVIANNLFILPEEGVPSLCVDCNSTEHSFEYIQLPVNYKPFLKTNHKLYMDTTSFLFITNDCRWRFSFSWILLRTMTRSRVTTSKVTCSI